MQEYEVKIQLPGKIFTDTVKAGDSNTANQIMKARYPGCVILNTKKI